MTSDQRSNNHKPGALHSRLRRPDAGHLTVIEGGAGKTPPPAPRRSGHLRLRALCLTASVLVYAAIGLAVFRHTSRLGDGGASSNDAGQSTVEWQVYGDLVSTPEATQQADAAAPPAANQALDAGTASETPIGAATTTTDSDGGDGTLLIGGSGSKSAFAPSGAAAGQDFRAQLLAHIESFKKYPTAARAARQDGVTRLAFLLTRDGGVSDIWIEQSSGYPVLDQEAVGTVLRAQPLPPVPLDLNAPLTVSLPVAFSLGS